MIEPGEIYWANLSDAGRHPVIIVSREELNRGHTVTAVILTSSRLATRRKLPHCVFFRAGEFGLTRDCVAQCETAGPLRQNLLEFDQGPIGVLSDEAMRDVIRAVGNVLNADCEPE